MTGRPQPKTIEARVARAGLKALGGWRYVGDVPAPRRAVCLATPHTDNMDGLLLVLLAKSVGLQLSWMVKDDWGKPPIGILIRKVGGVPIDRSKANGMVGSMVEEFERRNEFYLAIPPEGTRKRTDFWKSGFYRIALGAKVPVLPGFLDYAKKEGGFGPPIELSGDMKKDMDAIRAFYDKADPKPRHPDKFGPIRLREEAPSTHNAS
ncbi:MAG TPA: lysophospholipid acyltransferase family protein [Polyangiaceae bacterium]|nr:lysophospholipid acyltransferase family protein [Polyangiaceae bacterium]HMR73982.1 lysophospholipid acyltransferase family protein [Polyangiaceae bacterium]